MDWTPRETWPVTRRLRRRRREKADRVRPQLTGKQRLLILDSWLRSKLPAHDFAVLVGISPHTLYVWKKRFQAEGPAGLELGWTLGA